MIKFLGEHISRDNVTHFLRNNPYGIFRIVSSPEDTGFGTLTSLYDYLVGYDFGVTGEATQQGLLLDLTLFVLNPRLYTVFVNSKPLCLTRGYFKGTTQTQNQTWIEDIFFCRLGEQDAPVVTAGNDWETFNNLSDINKIKVLKRCNPDLFQHQGVTESERTFFATLVLGDIKTTWKYDLVPSGVSEKDALDVINSVISTDKSISMLTKVKKSEWSRLATEISLVVISYLEILNVAHMPNEEA